ncbi:MAG TPA: hypothetical protein VFW63_12080 [Acidimicrobiales bacterium]|nr:hypothetical protein [Acidimicrobiales bacterium]
MGRDEFLEAAAPLIGEVGSAFYFAPETLATGKDIGLDGFRYYFLGRGGVLGDVEAPVVASAFGYFKPSVVAAMWDSGRERCGRSPREVGRSYLACCHELGRSRYADVDDLAGLCAAAAAVDDAADNAGLALYAAISAEPRPDDLPARAAHLVAVLRELRGSAHLLAVRASGLAPRVAHCIKRPDDFAAFGWGEDERPTVTEADREALDRAEDLTDQIVAPAFAVLDDAGRSTLLSGLRQMQARLAG